MLINIKEDNFFPIFCNKMASVHSSKTDIRSFRCNLKGSETQVIKINLF